MFLNPLMLAGLGGAAVPFALHMLSRARYRPVPWGAMMFLEGTGTNLLRSHRIKQWALLGLRMAVVALLAMALARPVIAYGPPDAAEDARVTAAILVDCSASMSYDLGGRTRMDFARGAALQILSSLRRGDEAVLLTAGTGLRHVTPLPTSDLQSVANRISDLDSGNSAANFADALTNAMNVLDRVTRGKRELYVVCDRQATSWNQITETYVSAWRDRVGKSSQLDRFVVVPIGGEGSANVAVDSISPVTSPAIRDVPQQLEVRVRNYGNKAQVNVPLSVAAGDRNLLSSNINLPARGLQSISVPITFGSKGSEVITATIHDHGLTGDDRLSAAIEVVNPIQTLLITDADDSAHADNVTGYLQAALMPYHASGRRGTDSAVVSSIRASALTATGLRRTHVVIVDNVADLSDEQVRLLTQFVDTGGGLFVVAGDRVHASDYDARLYRGGSGLLPASLTMPSDEVGDAPIQVDALDHPIFRFLGGHAENATGSVLRRFGAMPASGAKVLARTASGEPLLIEQSRGLGRVLLLATGLGRQWGTLPETSFYVPFVQSVVRYLASISVDQHNVKPGDELVLTLRGEIEGRPSITLPDGSTSHPDVARLNSGTQLRYAATQQPGIYVIRAERAGEEIVENYVVQPGSEESDLTPMSSSRLAWLGQSLGFECFTRPEQAAARPFKAPATDLWLGLMVAVVGLLVLEMAASRFWYGTK